MFALDDGAWHRAAKLSPDTMAAGGVSDTGRRFSSVERRRPPVGGTKLGKGGFALSSIRVPA